MEEVKFCFMAITIFSIVYIGAFINNKLYDIRELQNGTCIHINSYDGKCK